MLSPLAMCAAQDHPVPKPDYPECADGQRDPSLSEGECIARMVLHSTQECKDLTGAEYRRCAAKVPSKINLPKPPKQPDPYAGMTEAQKQKATLCSRILANGGVCDPGQVMAALQKKIDDADREIARANEEIEKRQQCLQQLRIGMPVKRVLACGSPDHINSDLRGDDQWVYLGAHDSVAYVYINRLNKVADVQVRE